MASEKTRHVGHVWKISWSPREKDVDISTTPWPQSGWYLFSMHPWFFVSTVPYFFCIISTWSLFQSMNLVSPNEETKQLGHFFDIKLPFQNMYIYIYTITPQFQTQGFLHLFQRSSHPFEIPTHLVPTKRSPAKDSEITKPQSPLKLLGFSETDDQGWP